ncbi:hypothetical protein FG379_001630 [Cryptosporidium bovis]|uniref:uncharacterized protein n=1 Tax=Cryptosporidium bovis TaxID=310047 RepID=UPI003519FEB2|nr:hypothetical protein FG379_001630 [Cryptosporidium bovis]
MESEADIYKRRIELKKKKLLERGNSRLKLLCPGHEELRGDLSVDRNQSENADSNETENISVIESTVEYNKTNSAFISSKDSGKKVDFEGTKTFIEFMNGDISKIRKIISFIIGVILFFLHNYISSDANVYGYYPSNTSGLILFVGFQIFIIKLALIKYFQLNLKVIREKNVYIYHIFTSYDPGKADYIDLISDIYQFIIAIKNIVSEWYILLSTYVVINSIYNLVA